VEDKIPRDVDSPLEQVGFERDPLDLDGAEIAVLEEIADQSARARGDDDRIRPGQGLQPGREVRGLANDRLFLRRALTVILIDRFGSNSSNLNGPVPIGWLLISRGEMWHGSTGDQGSVIAPSCLELLWSRYVNLTTPTQLTFEHTDSPDEIDVTTGTLDDPVGFRYEKLPVSHAARLRPTSCAVSPGPAILCHR